MAVFTLSGTNINTLHYLPPGDTLLFIHWSGQPGIFMMTILCSGTADHFIQPLEFAAVWCVKYHWHCHQNKLSSFININHIYLKSKYLFIYGSIKLGEPIILCFITFTRETEGHMNKKTYPYITLITEYLSTRYAIYEFSHYSCLSVHFIKFKILMSKKWCKLFLFFRIKAKVPIFPEQVLADCIMWEHGLHYANYLS